MVTNIRTLRKSTKEILGAVSRGDTVFITNRGKTCAKIVPASSGAASTPHEAFGMWKSHKTSVKTYIDNVRKGRHVA